MGRNQRAGPDEVIGLQSDGMGGAVTSQWQPDLCRAAVEASAGRVYRSHGAPDGAQRVVEVALDSGKAAGEIGLDPDL